MAQDHVLYRLSLLDLDDDTLEQIVLAVIEPAKHSVTSSKQLDFHSQATPLLSTCRRLREITIPRIYARVYNWTSGQAVDGRRSCRLLRTTLDQPDLASSVRYLHIGLHKQILADALGCIVKCVRLESLHVEVAQWEEIEDFAWVEPCQAMSESLRTKGNLEILRIHIDEHRSQEADPFRTILQSLVVPSLRHFEVSANVAFPDLWSNADICLPELESLCMKEYSTRSNLASPLVALLSAIQSGRMQTLKICSTAVDADFLTVLVPRTVAATLRELSLETKISRVDDSWSSFKSLSSLAVGHQTPSARGMQLELLPPSLEILRIDTNEPRLVIALAERLEDRHFLPVLQRLTIGSTNSFFFNLRPARPERTSQHKAILAAMNRLLSIAGARNLVVEPASLSPMIAQDLRAWNSMVVYVLSVLSVARD
jgi:hypothetical protein